MHHNLKGGGGSFKKGAEQEKLSNGLREKGPGFSSPLKEREKKKSLKGGKRREKI